jgi:hypothetical protein
LAWIGRQASLFELVLAPGLEGLSFPTLISPFLLHTSRCPLPVRQKSIWSTLRSKQPKHPCSLLLHSSPPDTSSLLLLSSSSDFQHDERAFMQRNDLTISSRDHLKFSNRHINKPDHYFLTPI